MRKLVNKLFCARNLLQHLLLSIAPIVLAIGLVAAPANATGVYQIPNLSAGDRTWIIDKAEVLSRASEIQISNALENLAKETSNQVRIVTIHRLDYGETPESFTDKLFKKWFPTAEAGDHQTLLVIDTVTNGTAIHTGDQVRTILPDEIAQSVAQETVLAPLRDGNKYNQALSDASDRLVAILSGNPDPGPPQLVKTVNAESTFKKAEETDAGNATIWVVGLLLAATVIPMATYFWYQNLGS